MKKPSTPKLPSSFLSLPLPLPGGIGKRSDDGEPTALQRGAKLKAKAKAKARRLDTIGHLGPEAVVAFVDGEMAPKFMHRVRVHLVHCPECREDIRVQRGTAEWVRQSNIDAQVRAPESLMAKLASIGSADVAGTEGPDGPDAETPVYTPPQDVLDKLEMIIRAIRHNQGR